MKHAKPTLKHEKKTDIQQDDKKRKAQKKAAYHHSKPSELQEPTDTTMLRDTSASESAFKHQSDVMEPLPISDTISEQTEKAGMPGATATGTEKTKKSRKLAKAEKQVGRTDAKLNQAKENLPTKKKPRTRLVFDETKGKAKREFYFEKQVKPQVEHIKGPLSQRPVKMAANSAIAFGHKKIYQAEDENVGVKAGHRGEMVVEGGVRTALRHRKTAPYRKVAKLERAAMKKRVNLSHRQTLERNPKLKSNLFSRMWQKRNLKKQYAKAARNTKKAAAGAKKTGSLTVRLGKAVTRLVTKNPKVIIFLLIAGLLIAVIMMLFSLGAGIGSSGLGGIMGVVYSAEEEDINAAGLVYTEWETDLQIAISNAEASHPGFDEYRYEIGHIGHDPHVLMAFLTARFNNFTFNEIVGELRALFDAQYSLSFTPSVEIRTRTNADGEVVQYEWHILTVRLVSIPLMNVILPLMDDNQRQHFGVLMQTQGARQLVGSPFSFNWLPHVTSHYGWRIHPIRGDRALHLGVDVGLPTGTEILSAQDGTVTFAGYSGGFGNIVIIDDGNGIVTKYAHCHTLLVRTGNTVAMGDVIATVGSTGDSTGPHLHFEVLINGAHRNPVFFALTNPNLFSLDGGAGAMTAEQFAILYAEARRHLGVPYRYGANGPNAFDCSSYVAWVYRESGIYPLPRTTAQGIYNRSTPVPFGMQMPGDIVFFHSTYSTSDWITHIGVYLGGGRMIHAGSPVQYANINTPFWQRHLAGFGRLPW